MPTINNPDRLHAGYARTRRATATTWGAMAAGGGRIIRTTDSTVEAIATVGDHADDIARIVGTIDRSPATFLHDLAAAADGVTLDVPRLVRDVLAGRRHTGLPDNWTLGRLSRLRVLLADTKPGAAAALTDVVTTSLDPFGPVLVPATIKWFNDGGDHHTHQTQVELSMALAAADPGTIDDLIDELADYGSATLASGLIATLSDWDCAFAADMADADWETVEVIDNEQTRRLLTSVRDAEHPLKP